MENYYDKYIKYKNKYLQIKKKQYGGTPLQIIIDGIRFKLINKAGIAQGCHMRDIVLINSIDVDNNETPFFVYRSHSELGMWRFCILIDKGKQMAKGENYIMSTFIHIDLQNFINKNYNDIPFYSEIYMKDYEQFFMDCKLVQTGEIINDQQFNIKNQNLIDRITTNTLEHINSNSDSSNNLSDASIFIHGNTFSRCINDKYLLFINKCNTEACFASKSKNEFSDNFFKFMEKVKHSQTQQSHEKFFYETYMSLMNKHHPEYNERLVFNPTIFYETINKYMDNYFEITNHIYNKISEYETYLPNAILQTVNVTLYKLEHIMNKESGQLYTLLVSIHQDKKTSYHYFNIVGLIPVNAKICKYGIYDIISCSGPYVYKPFDYTKQVDLIYNNQDEYSFIGEYANNVWPLNISKPNDMHYIMPLINPPIVNSVNPIAEKKQLKTISLSVFPKKKVMQPPPTI